MRIYEHFDLRTLNIRGSQTKDHLQPVQKAVLFEIKKVFVLTRNPQFFSKVGFSLTTIDALPEKIRKDCEHCPKRAHCDEVAYEINFSYGDQK